MWVCLTHDVYHIASLWERQVQQQKHAESGVALREIAVASTMLWLVNESLKLWVYLHLLVRDARLLK